jgi:tRNA(fMet)-specific endonuclease VapC
VALGESCLASGSRERAKLEQWIEEVKDSCALMAADANTAGQYAEIREELRAAATPIPENDIWIAALCRQHQLAVASRDGHFDKVRGLKRVEW